MSKFRNLHKFQSALLAFCFAAFVCLIIPVQTYLGNAELFNYSAGDVVLACAPYAVAVFLAVWIALLLAEMVVGRLLSVIALAVLLCAYFETGIFSIGLPPLNGEMRAFSNPFRVLIDTGLLAGTFVLVVAAYKWIKEYAHWIALGVLVMGLASLCDVRKADEASKVSILQDGLCPQLDVVSSVRFSKERNVIMLILDSTPASLTATLMRDNPELQQRFPGFVAYEKNLATGEITARGLPGLMTGKQLTKEMSANEYSTAIFGPDSFIFPYAEAGMPVYFSDQLLTCGYTNRRLGDFSKIGDGLIREGPVLDRNSSDTPYLTLRDVVRFRLTPYRNKCSVLSQAYYRSLRAAVKKNVFLEENVYPMLAGAPLSDEATTALTVIHTSGIHGPITIDRHGQPLPAPTQDVKAHFEYGYYLLNQVADFLDRLRETGVYDNSVIVLAADHGLIVLREGDGTKGHGAESSILWVKPAHANQPFAFSGIPTSNFKVSDLMRAERTRDLTRDEIDAILEMHDRTFIAKFGSTFWSAGRAIYFHQWRYDDENHVVACENQGVFQAN